MTGGQGIIDTINDAIDKSGSRGKLGTEGYVKCNRNSHSQDVKWENVHA